MKRQLDKHMYICTYIDTHKNTLRHPPAQRCIRSSALRCREDFMFYDSRKNSRKNQVIGALDRIYLHLGPAAQQQAESLHQLGEGLHLQ